MNRSALAGLIARALLVAGLLVSLQVSSSEASGPSELKSFDGATDWANGKPVHMTDLKNKVVVVDFYTSRCSNCLAAVPHLAALYKKYRSQGLQVIGVHTPEMDSEHEISLVNATIKRLGIEYPVAIDNNNEIWNAYHNQYWPSLLIYDKSGRLVYEHAGEGAYSEIDNKIHSLL